MYALTVPRLAATALAGLVVMSASSVPVAVGKSSCMHMRGCDVTTTWNKCLSVDDFRTVAKRNFAANGGVSETTLVSSIDATPKGGLCVQTWKTDIAKIRLTRAQSAGTCLVFGGTGCAFTVNPGERMPNTEFENNKIEVTSCNKAERIMCKWNDV